MADTLITGTTLIENIKKVEVKPTEDSFSWDFTTGDFTTDGTYNSLDLSEKIPDTAEWVIINCFVKDGDVNATVEFSQANVTTKNALVVGVHVANEENNEQGWVKISPSRLLWYKARNTTWTDINIKIIGYV